ncbi:NUDIX hydrolase [Gandjariella thermophila]|uniref:NUDIX hydrolase n=1 Tax=Gandjariella thermophila TaxID=1931992 RepID=UPI001CEF87EB|nr:NUDIX domain-containing protein [Gandjariella thermophila]
MSDADELVAVYDRDGAVRGSAPRSVMRAEGLWHASTAVLVRSTAGDRVYVHRRSPDKDIFAGMHDCWAGGVVAAGEDPVDAATRELGEELGIAGVPLRPLFTLRYDAPPVRCHVHTYEARWDGPVVHQPEEIADGGWMPLDELRDRLANPAWPFVPDGRRCIEEWFRRRPR